MSNHASYRRVLAKHAGLASTCAVLLLLPSYVAAAPGVASADPASPCSKGDIPCLDSLVEHWLTSNPPMPFLEAKLRALRVQAHWIQQALDAHLSDPSFAACRTAWQQSPVFPLAREDVNAPLTNADGNVPLLNGYPEWTNLGAALDAGRAPDVRLCL